MGFYQYKILPYDKLASCHIDPSDWRANKTVKKIKWKKERKVEEHARPVTA
jgi:hypothetical protein